MLTTAVHVIAKCKQKTHQFLHTFTIHQRLQYTNSPAFTLLHSLLSYDQVYFVQQKARFYTILYTIIT